MKSRCPSRISAISFGLKFAFAPAGFFKLLGSKMRDLLVGAFEGCIASKKSMKLILLGSYSSLVVGRLLGAVVGAPLGAAEGNAVGSVGCGVGKAVGAGVAYFAATSGL